MKCFRARHHRRKCRRKGLCVLCRRLRTLQSVRRRGASAITGGQCRSNTHIDFVALGEQFAGIVHTMPARTTT
jgi:hypothetical protein